MNPNEAPNLLDECRQLAEDSLYAAQAHYYLANRKERQSRWYFYVPSIIAGASGALVALGSPGWVGIFSAIAGIVVGIGSALGVDRSAQAHRLAGNVLTALRHEARFAHETLVHEVSREQFLAEVRRLRDRYNNLLQTLPMTDQRSFEKARKEIQAGRHIPDFRTPMVKGAEGGVPGERSEA